MESYVDDRELEISILSNIKKKTTCNSTKIFTNKKNGAAVRPRVREEKGRSAQRLRDTAFEGRISGNGSRRTGSPPWPKDSKSVKYDLLPSPRPR